ncbi:MAG TPA: NlpC/P60 family protein [Gaiellaceae bacterium]
MPGLSKRHWLVAVAALAAALAFVASGAADPPEIRQKEAEHAQVLAEINAIDVQLEQAAEAYNGATYRLSQIRADLRENRARLRIAQQNYKKAQARVADRLVDLYESDDGSLTDILVGATSLTDLLDRLDAASRIGAQDAENARLVQKYRAEVRERERQLEAAESAQKQVVAKRAAERAAIEQKLGERKQLLVSIQGEIDRLKAEERERQARLAEEARQKLAEEKRERRAAEQHESSTQSSAPVQTDSAPSSSPSGSSSGGGSPPPSAHGTGVVAIALRYLGVPYVWGGASPSGFDCSGFTMYVYAQVGVSLPHYAAAQYGMGTPVSRGSLQPGDLVFFNGLSHVGMYIGGGRFVHAPHTGDVVKISSLYESWYASTYVGARRY